MKLFIEDNPNTKRAKAIYTLDDGKTKTITFGMKNSKGTFYDGATDEKKMLYLNRHKAREDWTSSGKFSAGFLSRWVLWSGNTKQDIIETLSKILKIDKKNIKIKLTKISVR